MSPVVNQERPYCVGHYVDGDTRELFPANWAELGRAEEAFAEILAPFDFAPGRLVLFVADIEEIVQVGPLEAACIALGLVSTNAVDAPFDASRVEAMTRRFDVAAVFGVSDNTLRGLAQLGHDPAKVFAGTVVWARLGAYEQLRGLPGVEVRRWVDLGPALAIGCVSGEAVHLDEREWRPEIVEGNLTISSRLPRATAFESFNTGVKAALDGAPCRCGALNRRISVSSQ